MSGASSKKRLQHTAFWGLGVGLLLSIAGALASPCRAQGTPRPTTVVLRTEAAPELRELADATGRLIRMEIDRAETLDTRGTPALYLEDLQMALGCMGETAECLTVVANELGVATLVYASLERSAARLLLTLAYFDGVRAHTVTRSVEAPTPDSAILDVVRPLVREVLGLPPLQEARPMTAAGPDATPETTPDPLAAEDAIPTQPRERRGLRPGAFAAAGVAALALGVGAFMAREHTHAEDDYRDAPVAVASEVDWALGRRTHAQATGRASVALFGVAGAAAVSAVVLGLMSRGAAGEDGEDEPSVAPSVVVGPGVFGLTLGGSL
ncbi:MAG: hypothetical protein H6726_03730 [Sandaracinaceae bacterium]|nr:hypothetical protein [Sandaracinaceae bacterium]